MTKRLCLLFLIIGTGLISAAQTAKLTGKVTNTKNEPLSGVSVKIVGQTGGTATDVEGRYTLTLSTGKKYELEFSIVGYESKIISDAEALTSQLNELNIVLDVKAKSGEEVVVTGRRSSVRLETVNSIIAFQKNTNTVASVISAESIRRSPDKNTGEVLKRTPGASLQEGRFIIVRGLADRYNQAMLNGILLTSTEPDRKTFSFDLIPASMIDNIIINKAFVPELPGEWAGGLIQVNTKDIPAQGFFNVQLGLGYNTITTGKDFYREKRGNLDWLGIDDGARALPASYTKKSDFDILTPAEKTAIGKSLPNRWVPEKIKAGPNFSFQTNGGFATNLFGKKLGGSFGILYAKSYNDFDRANIQSVFEDLTTTSSTDNFDYNDATSVEETNAGAMGSLTMQLNPLNKVSLRSIINVNTTNSILYDRMGIDYSNDRDVRGSEFRFRQNTFFTGQVSGDHGLTQNLNFKWYGAFNILDGYIPDQRRILYGRPHNTTNPFRLIMSNTLSQQSGSRIYQALSDYIYTGGGDLSLGFNLFGRKQTLKGGYMLQIKDRLYDAKLFSIYMPISNDALLLLPQDQVFDPSNFGDGSSSSNLFAFDAIKGSSFRYLANTILNAGYLQFDNDFSNVVRVVWGLRVENYDQLIGSVKKWDVARHSYSKVTDFLPGVNATFRLNSKTNLRLSASQTVVRPEFRELASLNLYDLELNASVQGNPGLKRTKVTNADLRYELYPRAGETFSVGVFFKHFDDPIEALFNGSSGGASSFNFQNADKATAYGAEIEVRKKLDFTEGLKNFTIQGNASYIKSKVTFGGLTVDRPLLAQSPYVLNAGLLYDLEKPGFNATLLFNQIGRRLAFVGNSEDGYRDIYEWSRPVLDFQLSQKVIQKKGEIRLNIANILDKKQYFYVNADTDLDFKRSLDKVRFARNYGTTFTLIFNYTL